MANQTSPLILNSVVLLSFLHLITHSSFLRKYCVGFLNFFSFFSRWNFALLSLLLFITPSLKTHNIPTSRISQERTHVKLLAPSLVQEVFNFAKNSIITITFTKCAP